MTASTASAPGTAEGEEGAMPKAPPVFSDEALYGPIGDYVRHIAPQTEAAPAALHASALAAIGALIGRGPTLRIDGASHHPRLFVMICGPTSTGRKSTAMNRGARDLSDLLDADFARHRTASGLSTGEGLIDAVRDATPDSTDAKGKPVPGDPGVADKRLLVLEQELGGTFQKLSRQGNSLSAVLRQAWDGQALQTMTRSNKLLATDPHIAVIGCITPHDLRESLASVEVANGLANRFLFVWTDRVRLLPHGGDDTPVPDELLRRLRNGIDGARRRQFVRWSAEAAERWSEVYPELTSPTAGGQLASLLARGAPQVCRIALLYAVMDGVGEIQLPHLNAALAFWRYSDASVRYLYQSADSLSTRARRILDALQEAGNDGLSRERIRDVVGSNAVPVTEITRELASLREAGLAHAISVPTAGRPREVWRHAHFLGSGLAPDSQRPDLSSLTSHISHSHREEQGTGSGPGLDPYSWDEMANNAA